MRGINQPIALIVLLVLCPSFGWAAVSDEGAEFFEKNIRPVLADRCYNCHSSKAERIKGGLRLDTRAGLLHGGKDGVVLVPGDPDNSRLIAAIRYSDPDLKMPPKTQLTAEQIATFEKWVKMGAPDPRIQPPSTTVPSTFDLDKEKQFWSFQPISDVKVPDVSNRDGLISPIDYFLQAGYEKLKLHPMRAASKEALIRRATYDLTGLPPTPDEVRDFVADQSSGAFEKLVDRLLASPHYGEAWGRHWLDVVRYADTSGCNADFPIPQLYKYRNYVIDSFNADKPYDQFLREQIAGDLLPAEDDAQKHEQIIATGYLAMVRRFGSGADEFHLSIADALDNLGKSMLGLSIGCARCHDHKFDPIPTSDYYALYGILDSTKFAFPGTELYRHPKDFVPLGSAEDAKKLHDYEQEVAHTDKRIHQLSDARMRLEADEKALKGATTRPTFEGMTREEVEKELGSVKKRAKELDEQGPPNVDRAYAVSEGIARDAQIQRKGEPTDLGDEVRRGFLTILGGQKLPESEKGSGRLELAQWITDKSNPLTARVMANRIWEYHFGKGIVATPNDFGHRGQPPFDQQLLDYLATRFIDSGWSVKSMHKLMMLSRAYQMDSAEDETNAAIDPGNVHLWRFNPRRLSAEEIRDSILADSGALDAAVDPGPHPFPPQRQWHYTQHNAFVADYPTNRRSIYLMQQRIRKQRYLALFDGADTNDTSPDRPLSTTAVQALFMMNDPFVQEQAQKLADRVASVSADDPNRIDFAYRLLYCRPPASDELESALHYLRDVSERLRESGTPADQLGRSSLSSYLRVLLSSNEFIWLE